MIEKYRIRRIQLGGYHVWALYHSSLAPLGRRYYWTWDGALRHARWVPAS